MTEKEFFNTLAGPAEGTYKEKRSKFLAFAFPVDDRSQIKARLDHLKKKYFDARHHCYAYRLGPRGEDWRANDDGEPAYTAGKPILGQLLTRELTDTLIVVVRYFGGIKLGVPGLINAYRSAARDALDKARIVKKQVLVEAVLQSRYEDRDKLMKYIKEKNLQVIAQDFGEPCRITVRLCPSEAGQIPFSMTDKS